MSKPQNAKAQNNQFWREQSMKRGKEIEQLRAENDALRRQLAVLADNKAESVSSVSVLAARQKRDKYRRLAESLARENEIFRSLLPMTILVPGPGEIPETVTGGVPDGERWPHSLVAILVFTRDTSTGSSYLGRTEIGVYDAPREQAASDILEHAKQFPVAALTDKQQIKKAS